MYSSRIIIIINSWFSAPPTCRTLTHYTVKFNGMILELDTVASLEQEHSQGTLETLKLCDDVEIFCVGIRFDFLLFTCTVLFYIPYDEAFCTNTSLLLSYALSPFKVCQPLDHIVFWSLDQPPSSFVKGHELAVRDIGFGGLAQWFECWSLAGILSQRPWSAPDLWLTGDHFLGKLSAMSQPARPTRPFIPAVLVNE